MEEVGCDGGADAAGAADNDEGWIFSEGVLRVGGERCYRRDDGGCGDAPKK
eukprot:CAMPEP_0172502100 /NCGR_PEP_ID=MMETSP1066-20121228/156659_1 /TAXON_ID=671091 /ORGANISM="Coscinodiscus wailesii, Strain CCMP2513" /LENGTH=50 /DNA_ID=CAMNT_0013277229 /DNA_START=51 /DNA_END=200 /DNA_ORIENTATION=-